jgi:hypothetical protein
MHVMKKLFQLITKTHTRPDFQPRLHFVTYVLDRESGGAYPT